MLKRIIYACKGVGAAIPVQYFGKKQLDFYCVSEDDDALLKSLGKLRKTLDYVF